MIYLELFLAFLEIGAVSFGGGYGMISMIREKTVSNGWLTEGGFIDLLAIAESTPGPIAVNSATYVGSLQGTLQGGLGAFGGVIGALCATAGVVLPSFIIILVIAALVSNLLKFAGVQAFLEGVRPVVIGLIGATGLSMLVTNLIGLGENFVSVAIDWRAIIIFTLLVGSILISKKVFKKKIPPILLIVISAVLGILIYSI